MLTTEEAFNKLIADSLELFRAKTRDYGTAWRILRLPSITDQIYIKANRIRSVQDKGIALVDEGIEGEFVAIFNYAVMALIQMDMPNDAPLELSVVEATTLYQKVADENLALLARKNHDYGEAWRQMRISSITDIILMKLLRIKQIEDNMGQTSVSEGVEGGYRDMFNYAGFALIHLKGWA
jgi:Nucleotide modification associated domain 1